MTKKKNSVAKEIGSFLAELQSTLDDVFSFLFKKLKEVGDKQEKNKSKEKNKCFRKKALRCSKKIAGFFGEVGKSFYERYDDLKKKKN